MPKVMKDILRDQDGDLLFVAQDIVFGESTRYHQEDLLLTHVGGYKEDPTVGCGVSDWLLDDDLDLLDLRQIIQSQFEKDGMIIEALDMSQFPNTIIRAVYE